MSYQRRDLQIEFTLGEGDFDGRGGNVITLKNMKCELSVAAFGGRTGTTMELALYGLSLDYMAKLTNKTQNNIAQKQHSIRVKANDEYIFAGTIVSSRIDLNQMPNAPIELTANAVDRERYIVCEPTSMQGSIDIAVVIKSIAERVGLKFINVDVNKKIENPHYTGNAIQQINKIAKEYSFSADVDMGTVTIYTGGAPIDGVVPFISPDNGLKGYPIFYDIGLNFRCVFSSLIQPGRKIRLETGLPNGSGDYYVRKGTTHYLSSNTDGGLWDTYVVAQPLDMAGSYE